MSRSSAAGQPAPSRPICSRSGARGSASSIPRIRAKSRAAAVSPAVRWRSSRRCWSSSPARRAAARWRHGRLGPLRGRRLRALRPRVTLDAHGFSTASSLIVTAAARSIARSSTAPSRRARCTMRRACATCRRRLEQPPLASRSRPPPDAWHARHVIGADGANSLVRRRLGRAFERRQLVDRDRLFRARGDVAGDRDPLRAASRRATSGRSRAPITSRSASARKPTNLNPARSATSSPPGLRRLTSRQMRRSNRIRGRSRR